MGILRFILAISVVLNHSTSIFGFVFVGGVIAVKAFYIISGFYMTLVLNEKYKKINHSYRLFITNRFLRLFPIYWVVFFLTVLSSIIIYNRSHIGSSLVYYVEFINTLSFTTFLFLVFTNVFLFFQDIVMFLGLDTVTGNLFFTTNFHKTNPKLYEFLFIPQAWTIGVEITFYLFAPFIVRRKLWLIFSLIVFSFLIRLGLTALGLHDDPWSYRFFPSELVFFLLGTLSYHLYLYFKNYQIKEWHLMSIMFFVIFITLFNNFFPTYTRGNVYLIFFFASLPFIFILTKDWKYDRYIGDLSYPIYISHLFMLLWMNFLDIPIIISQGFTLTFLTVIFSILLNYLVMKKIEKKREERVIDAIANERG